MVFSEEFCPLLRRLAPFQLDFVGVVDVEPAFYVLSVFRKQPRKHLALRRQKLHQRVVARRASEAEFSVDRGSGHSVQFAIGGIYH